MNLAKKTFKDLLNLCYEEEGFPELHQELLSLEVTARKTKDYVRVIEELMEAIPLYADDFPEDVMEEIENLHQEYLDSLEN